MIIDALAAAVSTFDSLGKRLQKEFPALLSDKPKNLFQNLDALSEALRKNYCKDLAALIGPQSYTKIHYLFQVRHIWSHNFGEADEDFIRKTGSSSSLLRTKIAPSEADIQELLTLLDTLGVSLRKELADNSECKSNK